MSANRVLVVAIDGRVTGKGSCDFPTRDNMKLKSSATKSDYDATSVITFAASIKTTSLASDGPPPTTASQSMVRVAKTLN